MNLRYTQRYTRNERNFYPYQKQLPNGRVCLAGEPTTLPAGTRIFVIDSGNPSSLCEASDTEEALLAWIPNADLSPFEQAELREADVE